MKWNGGLKEGCKLGIEKKWVCPSEQAQYLTATCLYLCPIYLGINVWKEGFFYSAASVIDTDPNTPVLLREL